MKKAARLIISVAVCLSVGFAGSLATIPSIPTWYAGINKPFFNPPSWVFGPVWTMLFVLMGISAFLIWEKGINKKEVKNALLVFAGQLILNFLWSFIFFGLHSPWLAFIEIVLLWLAIFTTIKKFQKISLKAAKLLLPYIAWITFAAFLNLSVAILN